MQFLTKVNMQMAKFVKLYTFNISGILHIMNMLNEYVVSFRI